MGGGNAGKASRSKAREAATGNSGRGGLAQGLRFERDPGAADARYRLVKVDVARLDRSWQRDTGFALGPGGIGPSAKPGAYANAQSFLRAQRAKGLPVHAPRVSLDRKGQVSIGDGRHRFAALRDSGAQIIFVTATRSQANRIRKLYGP
jgi:hypothetical protein